MSSKGRGKRKRPTETAQPAPAADVLSVSTWHPQRTRVVLSVDGVPVGSYDAPAGHSTHELQPWPPEQRDVTAYRDAIAVELERHGTLAGGTCTCGWRYRPGDSKALHRADALVPLMLNGAPEAPAVTGPGVPTGDHLDDPMTPWHYALSYGHEVRHKGIRATCPECLGKQRRQAGVPTGDGPVPPRDGR